MKVESVTLSELIDMEKKRLLPLDNAFIFSDHWVTTVQYIRKAKSNFRGQTGEYHFTGEIKPR